LYSNFILSYFNAIFIHSSSTDAEFKIIECNQFRHLNHLILRLKSASDHTMKKYLSNLVIEFKDKSENLYKDNLILKDNIENISARFKQLGDDMFNIKEKNNLEVETVKINNNKELNELKEKLLNDYQSRLDIKEREKSKEIKDIQEKYNNCSNEKNSLQEINRNLEEEKKSVENQNNLLTIQLENTKKKS